MSSRRRVVSRVIIARHAARIAAVAHRPRPKGARGPSMPMDRPRGSCSHESEEHARIVIHDRLEGCRETRDVSITSRHHPRRLSLSSFIRPRRRRRLSDVSKRANTRLTVRDLANRLHEYMNNCRARSQNCGTDYSLRSRSDGLATCVTAMTVPTATAFERLPLSVSVRPFFSSRDPAVVPRASSHPCEFNTG